MITVSDWLTQEVLETSLLTLQAGETNLSKEIIEIFAMLVKIIQKEVDKL